MRPLPTLIPLCLAALPAAGQEAAVPATLVGRSVLPAATFQAPPEDAPREAFTPGRFLNQMARADEPFAVEQRTGLDTPFLGQPVQGISGFALERPAAGGLWAVIDNGFGSKRNSPDALLSFVRLVPDFATGETAVAERVWLRDPDRAVPFRIVNEATPERYLTGGDLDTESIQVIGDAVWIGDEFGPFLVSATLDGRVTGVFETLVDGEPVRSPDHPAAAPDAPPGPAGWRAGSSGGFEGLGLAPDGTLWAALEQPLRLEDGSLEPFVRILQFDPAAGAWTGEERRLALADGATAIGDLNFLDGTRALLIERDNGAGLPDRACPEGTAQADARGCFPTPAAVKRVTLVDWGPPDAEGLLRKLRGIDLLAIDDPEGVGGEAGTFAFPFQTIESVVADGPEHVLVANDNNLPFSSGRDPDAADDNELVRLRVPGLLAE